MLSKRVRGVVVGLMVAAARLGAQAWDDPRVLAMVQRATDRRVQQLADSGLTGYQATARGYVTFLAQVGEGFRELPRVVKADELALEVYWRAPNLSKQRIVGRRDTTLVPTDIRYHQDHLGIIQNNFPAVIRLGDGDEVRDVPHPLSVAGLGQYQFALTDSLRITTPSVVIDVYEIKVRPKDDTQPRIVGAVYLDRESAQVVRMAFGFTRPAYLDKQLEDVFVVLENGVVGGRFWLPRRQEVEIRRTLTWLDYPVRGMIRGRWEIGGYELNTDVPPTLFRGPEIVSSPPAALQAFVWPPGRLTDSLPEESRLPTPAEIKRTMEEVRALARARVTRQGRLALSARSASDFVRFDRTSGIALGAGATARLGNGLLAEVRPRFGFGEHVLRGQTSFGWESVGGNGVRVFARQDVRDVGDFAERSVLVNSLAAQEFGSDMTDFYGVRGWGGAATVHAWRTRWTLAASREEQSPMTVVAKPFNGTARVAYPARDARTSTASLSLDLQTTQWGGVEWRAHGEGRKSEVTLCAPGCGVKSSASRASLFVEARRELGPVALAISGFGGAVSATNGVLAQDLIVLGGPVSAPGQAYHSLFGDRGVAQTIEVRFPVPFPRISLGRFGTSPGRASVAPHWTNVWMHRVPVATTIWRAGGPPPLPDPLRLNPTGYYRSAGVSIITAFDLLKFDVSRALPNGAWIFSLDVARQFWSIL